jgi:hypothetical protein
MLMFPLHNMDGWKKIFVRAAGAGAGTVVALTIVCSIGFWWIQRPKPWSDRAISASFNEIDFQEVGDQLNLTFQYTFHNLTNDDYALPPSGSGAMMRQIPEKGGLDKIVDATWDNNLVIPPKQSLNVKFLVPYRFSDYNTSAKELSQSEPTPFGTTKSAGTSTDIPEGLEAFFTRRLKEIDGFAFFDYSKKYKIVLPKWPVTNKEK